MYGKKNDVFYTIYTWVTLFIPINRLQNCDLYAGNAKRECIIYNKTDRLTIQSAFAQTTIHTANIIFTNVLMADKHNIPKGKMHSNCRLLPNNIVCKITQRNNIRRANTSDPALKLLNEEITSDIQIHKQNLWKEHLDAHWDHRHNTFFGRLYTVYPTKHLHPHQNILRIVSPNNSQTDTPTEQCTKYKDIT